MTGTSGPNTAGPESVLGHFSRAAAASLTGTCLNLVGGFAALYAANRLLGKEVFASYAFATTLVFFAGVVCSAGLDRVIVYAVSSNRSSWTEEEKSALLARVFRLVLILGCFGTAAFAVLALPLQAGTGLPDLAAIAIPVSTMALSLPLIWCLTEHYRSAEQFGTAYVVPALVEPLRAAGLQLCLALGYGSFGAGTATAIAAALPVVLLWLFRKPPLTRAPSCRLPSALARYALKAAGVRLLKEATLRANLIVLGLLSTAAATADFAVTSRIAMAFLVAQTIMAAALGPRVAQFFAEGRHAELKRDIVATRDVSIALVAAGAALLCLVAPWLLSLFGPYSGAYPLLFVLLTAIVAEVVLGPVMLVLSMAGFAGTTLALRGGSLAMMLVISVILVPQSGAIGAAIAVLAATVAGSFGAIEFLRRRLEINIISRSVVLRLAASVFTLSFVAGAPDARSLGSAFMLIVALWSAVLVCRARRGATHHSGEGDHAGYKRQDAHQSD